MDDLHLMRHYAYEAAGKYHAAHGKFFNSLVRGNRNDVIQAALKAQNVAAVYRRALETLITYLTEAGLSIASREEILRAMQTIDILDKEMKMLAAHQQSEAVNPTSVEKPTPKHFT